MKLDRVLDKVAGDLSGAAELLPVLDKAMYRGEWQ